MASGGMTYTYNSYNTYNTYIQFHDYIKGINLNNLKVYSVGIIDERDL
jgi:hypothetical protein